MELGDLGIHWIAMVPEFRGNKALPPGDRLSLEIERMRTAEVLPLAGNNQAENDAWLDSTTMRAWRDHPEFGPKIRAYAPRDIAVFRQFVEHTRSFTNFVFDGTVVTDPVEIFLRSPFNLTNEITQAINAAAFLTGQALKNFASQCDGIASATAVLSAPEGTDRPPASIPPA